MPLVETDAAVRAALNALTHDFWVAKDRNPRDDLHALFQYPAMMVPEHQTELIAAMRRVDPGIHCILDPFVGAGTTMTSCMHAGISFVGQDINPLAVLICLAKSALCSDSTLNEALQRIRRMSASDTDEAIVAKFAGIDKWFHRCVQLELSKLHRAIRREHDVRVRRFFWVVLAETVRRTSNSRTSTYKLHIRPEHELLEPRSPHVVFHEAAKLATKDAKHFRDELEQRDLIVNDSYTGSIQVHPQDTTQRVLPSYESDGTYDLVVTSPPYGDNTSTVPYGQQAYLPLQWIDWEDIHPNLSPDTWLRTTSEIDRRSLGGRRPKALADVVADLSERSEAFRETASRLRSFPRDRLGRVTSYTKDLDRALPYIVNRMREGSYAIWFLGNRHLGRCEVPTSEIFLELSREHDLRLVHRAERQLVFRRMAARNAITSMMRKEHILIMRKAIA